MKPNYKLLSHTYDLLDTLYFNRFETSPRTAMLNAVPREKISVLDICAGTCSNSILIAENRPQAMITALDLSADMLKIAEKKFRLKGIKNIETIVSDACNTGYPNGYFDVILLSLILHEISENSRAAMLKEAKRLLTPNGRLIVIEWEQPKSPSQKILFTPIKQLEPRGFKEFLQRDLAAYFENLGFAVIEKRHCDYTKVYQLRKC
ncbi:MAG: methyltransferase domain-containing protein [Oscillospiraceae bacterium]|nr:methyltransferase domain-containing protein [Oscillospiraceae bacterium]